MKNPFLQDRNIFSKAPKQNTKLTQDDKQPQAITDKIPPYDSKYGLKQQIKPINNASTNLRLTNQISSTYQRQPINYTSSQINVAANKYMSSQKITFGDPMSSQAYNGDRTSGYFNMMNSQQQQNISKPTGQTKYDNLKYEPRKNNFFEPDNKNMAKESFQANDMNMKETRKQFGKGYNYANYRNKNDQLKIEYEFAPPPINNFTTTQPTDTKYQYQATNYEYKPSFGSNQQRPSYQSNQQKPYQQKQTFTNDSNFMNKNPFTSNSYKSPPKQYDPLVTPKNDISQRFKENNYAEFSPIGQVSRHKINEDSIMNLDGLMDGIQLDKLLAESRTQEELLKILGMDTSMIKKSHDSGNKHQAQYDFKANRYESKPPEVNPYTSKYQPSQTQNKFNKKPYQPQPNNEPNRFQTYKDEDDEPQVFNYGESSLKNPVQNIRSTQNQPQNNRQSPPKFIKPSNNVYIQPQTNYYHYSQIPDQKPTKTLQTNINPNQQEEYDVQKIMQREMEKFMMQQQGFSRDKRVFMTANQKIVTKKYKLQSL